MKNPIPEKNMRIVGELDAEPDSYLTGSPTVKPGVVLHTLCKPIFTSAIYK